jgi:hypothetical protein
MGALGRLDEAERSELGAHLLVCDECRAMSAELSSTVSALDTWTESAAPAPIAIVSLELADAVLADLQHSDDRVALHRRIRIGAILAGSIAAVVVIALLFVAGTHGATPPTRTVALQGAPGVTASALLVEKPWGTSLTIHEQGLVPGQTYTVSMANSRGRWWTAGSYRTTSSAPLDATMACAAQYNSIDQIKVTDSGGRSVLRSTSSATY